MKQSSSSQRIPKGFLICCALVVITLIGAIISLMQRDEDFIADIFVEVSVFVVFVAGFFTNTRRLQFIYLLVANIYVIIFLGIFGKVFYDNFNQGIGILVLIQIIFSTINLIPIIIYHLSNRTFFYSYQRQLIYPTMFFAFVLLGRLPGGDVLTSEVSHEIFSLIIFAQAFSLFDSIHKIGKAHHMAAYADTSADDDEDEEEENPAE